MAPPGMVVVEVVETAAIVVLAVGVVIALLIMVLPLLLFMVSLLYCCDGLRMLVLLVLVLFRSWL